MTSNKEPRVRNRRALRARLLRLEARATLTTKLAGALVLVMTASMTVAWVLGWERAAFQRILLRTAAELAVFVVIAALLARRSRRIADLARDVGLAGDFDPAPRRLEQARDELLVIEREIRTMGRDLTLGSRQQAVMAQLTRLIRADGDVQGLLDFTVEAVAADLGARHVAMVEWDADLRRLVTRAANVPEAADRVVEVLLARPGLVEQALLAVGPAQVVPRDGLVAAFVPIVDHETRGLLVVMTNDREGYRQEDLDYLAGVAGSLFICLINSTDRLRLQATESEFRAMIDRVPGILYTRSSDFPSVTTFVSDQVEAVLGTPPSAWVQDSDLWVQRMHPADRKATVAALRVAQTEGTTFDAEYRLSTEDGAWRWFHDTAVLADAPGAAPSYQGILVDVTHEKDIEAELQVEQARLRAIVEASPVIIVSVSTEGINEFISSAVYTVTGRSADEIVGMPATTHAHPDDVAELTASFADVLSGRRSRYRGTYRYLHADGHWLTMEARGEPLRDRGDEVVGVVFALTDVSETVGLAVQLRAAKDAAERANVAKSEFLSRMSHELRTPMNAVLGFAQLLELEELEEDGRESVDQILRAGGHLLNLIDEVLDISRIEAGRLNVSLEPVAFRALVGEVMDLLRPAAERAQVDVQIRGDLEGAVLADPQRFKQVVLNIVGNAVKYNRPGGQVVVAAAPVQASGAMVRLSVQDTGRGIPADKLERVFTPFDRLGVEESGIEGTGLGLALSHRLIEVMGGVLGVESTMGSGSTFWVDLPKAVVSDVRVAPGQEAVRRRSPGALLSGRVLYVEDNLSNLRLVERLLGRHPDIDLLSAMQGTIGVQLARDHSPDVVLLDLNLPDIDGDVVLEQLKADERTRHIPVVIISADATARQVERLKALGAHDYLTKPIDVPELLATLGELLDARAREGKPS